LAGALAELSPLTSALASDLPSAAGLASLLSAGASSLSARRQVALTLLVRLEVGLVPAGAFEAKYRSGDQFLERLLPAGRAFLERLFGYFLQYLDVEPAIAAFVFVERHGFLESLSSGDRRRL
jgi:hypothetical protein